jgi:hypothetical protein
MACNTGTDANPKRILILGQSNAACHAETRTHTQTCAVFADYFGQVVLYRDPVRGATTWEWGEGSVWAIAGDKIIQNGKATSVTFCNFARGGSAVWAWSELGQADVELGFPGESACYDLLLECLSYYQSVGKPFDAIIWMQGESDRGRTESFYTSHLLSIINTIRVYSNAPIYISQTSVCGDSGDANIRAAQYNIVANNPTLNLRHGVNTDAIAPASTRIWHADNCHLSYQNQLDIGNAYGQLLSNNF